MQLAKIAQKLNLKQSTAASEDIDVEYGYASDLLSDVLAKAKKGTLWATNQKHQNIVGVAVMLDLAGVVIAGGIEPDENTIEKAVAENIALYTTDKSLFEVAGKLWELGIRSC